MHSKENDPLCQSLIECRYGQTVHLQQDVFHSWSDLQELVEPSTFLDTLPKEQAIQFLSDRRQTLCFPCRSHRLGPRHFRRCEIGQPNNDTPPDISLEVAGTPCQDYSPCGARLGSFGPRFLVFWAWILRVRFLQPRVILHENVIQFPAGLLTAYLSDLYIIIPLMVDPADSGMAALSRQRSYTILYHRSKVEVLATPQLLYMYLAQHLCWYNQVADPDDFFTASPDEVKEEILFQARRRRMPTFNKWDDPEEIRKTLLSQGEIGRLEGYEQFPDCNCNSIGIVSGRHDVTLLFKKILTNSKNVNSKRMMFKLSVCFSKILVDFKLNIITFY